MLCVYGAIWFYSKQLKSNTFVKTDICCLLFRIYFGQSTGRAGVHNMSSCWQESSGLCISSGSEQPCSIYWWCRTSIGPPPPTPSTTKIPISRQQTGITSCPVMQHCPFKCQLRKCSPLGASSIAICSIAIGSTAKGAPGCHNPMPLPRMHKSSKTELAIPATLALQTLHTLQNRIVDMDYPSACMALPEVASSAALLRRNTCHSVPLCTPCKGAVLAPRTLCATFAGSMPAMS